MKTLQDYNDGIKQDHNDGVRVGGIWQNGINTEAVNKMLDDLAIESDICRFEITMLKDRIRKLEGESRPL